MTRALHQSIPVLCLIGNYFHTANSVNNEDLPQRSQEASSNLKQKRRKWRLPLSRSLVFSESQHIENEENDDILNVDITLNDMPTYDEFLQTISNICQPRHIHLSVGRTQNATHSSMIVSFSFSPECDLMTKRFQDFGETAPVGSVMFGEDPENMSFVAIGNPTEALSYNVSTAHRHLKKGSDAQSIYFSDLYYHIEIDGLEPGTRYYYECTLAQEEVILAGFDENYTLASRKRQSEEIDESTKNGNGGGERSLNQQHLRRTLPQKYIEKSGERKEKGSQQKMKTVAKSDYATFLTPPAPGGWYSPPLDRTIKFAILGDLATRPHSRTTISNLEHNRLHNNRHYHGESLTSHGESASEQELNIHHGQGIDCILLAGDLSYANGKHTIWDDWMEMMGDYPFFRSIPVQIAMGNHDLDYDPTTLQVALAYENRFRMPQVMPAIRDIAPNDLFRKDMIQAKDFIPYEYGNAYYSFTFGPSKHIVLSSYSSFQPGSTQYQWLLSELKSIDRSVTPWLIVMLHCPLYTTFKEHHDEIFVVEARVHLEPIFVQHVVNFVIAGHIHSYMRTVPTANSKPHPKGPIYIIQGNGGRNANEPYLNETAEEWVKVRDHSMYGYGSLELFNATHAHWKWVKTGFNSEDEGGKHRFEPDYNLHDSSWVFNQWFIGEGDLVEGEEVDC